MVAQYSQHSGGWGRRIASSRRAWKDPVLNKRKEEDEVEEKKFIWPTYEG
jgi:hypothetical protein